MAGKVHVALDQDVEVAPVPRELRLELEPTRELEPWVDRRVECAGEVGEAVVAPVAGRTSENIDIDVALSRMAETWDDGRPLGRLTLPVQDVSTWLRLDLKGRRQGHKEGIRLKSGTAPQR